MTRKRQFCRVVFMITQCFLWKISLSCHMMGAKACILWLKMLTGGLW